MAEIVKKQFILEGLDCAGCATKIEDKTNELHGVKAGLNFVTKTLTIEIENKVNTDQIIEQMRDIVKQMEPHVVVKDIEYENEPQPHHEHEENKNELIRIGIGGILFALAGIFKLNIWVEFLLYFSSYLLVGGEVLYRAGRNIIRGQIFDENFLMALATIGAFIIGEFPEGVAVMLFYQIGEFFQGRAVNHSRKSIAALMDIRPDYANLKVGEEIKKVSPYEVPIGGLIVVRPGEKIPLDGRVVEGNSMVDTSALTGESVPREVQVHSEVLGGFMNKNGLLTIEVDRIFEESTVSKILELVENAGNKKAPTENFITKFARYYTPVVVWGALALAVIPPLLLKEASFETWIYRALIFLVISCPCALVVSIPLGFFGGIGGASQNGILVKGGNYLEGLNKVDTVVFDKTGTLTKGVFKVTEVEAKEINEAQLLEYAALAESYSNHPIGQSIVKAYGKPIDQSEIESYEEIAGHGIRAQIKGQEVLVGNEKLMQEGNIPYEKPEELGTIIHLALDQKYMGYILISDEIKEDSKSAIEELKQLGIKKIVMLTGDSKETANRVAEQLGLDQVYGELLPQHKVEILEQLEKQKSSKGKLIFVGDGINDAPVLARADIGVAMGGLGSDAAIEAADVVLMTDEPSKLGTAIKIARRTNKIVWQNILFALGVKGIVLMLGAGGIATMWEAVFADVGVALIAVLNAMRVMRFKG